MSVGVVLTKVALLLLIIPPTAGPRTGPVVVMSNKFAVRLLSTSSNFLFLEEEADKDCVTALLPRSPSVGTSNPVGNDPIAVE